MNKYMVFLHGEKPEIIEAESFEVNGGVLGFITGDGLSAAFYSWVGIKQLSPPVAQVTMTSTTNAGGSATVSYLTTAPDPTS